MTPIQVAAHTALIANRGIKVPIHLFKEQSQGREMRSIRPDLSKSFTVNISPRAERIVKNSLDNSHMNKGIKRKL